MRRPRVAVATVVISVGALAACADDGGDRGAPPANAKEDHQGASAAANGARRVAVSGRSFAFGPDELTVGVGEDIAIVLNSVDSLHDFTIDELDAHVAAEAGQTAVGGLRAERPGRYRFYCSVAGHREAGMEGVLVVEA